jgi:hypothetical protein
MTQKSSTTSKKKSVEEYQTWPDQQGIATWAGTQIMVTRFDDHDDYSPALRKTTIERSKDRNLSHHFGASDPENAVKVYDVEKWATPESDLINARALEMFLRVSQKSEAIVDASWASVYSDRNFVLPHSHRGSIASILYMLDSGEESDVMNGAFLFTDPRLKPCCQQQDGFMTTPAAPKIQPGTMVMFPGKTVHMVTPYYGSVPRITMSWDLKLKKDGASAVPSFLTRPN